MSQDISFLVVIEQSTHALPVSKEPGRARNGDIIHTYLTPDIATFSVDRYICNQTISSNRLGFIHCTGVPESVSLKIAWIQNGDDSNNRTYYFSFPHVPAAKLAELNNNREITVQWVNARPYIRNRNNDLGLTDQDIIGME